MKRKNYVGSGLNVESLDKLLSKIKKQYLTIEEFRAILAVVPNQKTKVDSSYLQLLTEAGFKGSSQKKAMLQKEFDTILDEFFG